MYIIPSIALGLLLVATTAAALHAECELYTTCADCTCREFDYDLQSSCSSGCAWEVAAQRCVSANDARSSGVEAFYKLWKTDEQDPSTRVKEKMLEQGQTTCSVGTGASRFRIRRASRCTCAVQVLTVLARTCHYAILSSRTLTAASTMVTMACFAVAAIAFTVFMIFTYRRDKRQASVEVRDGTPFPSRVRCVAEDWVAALSLLSHSWTTQIGSLPVCARSCRRATQCCGVALRRQRSSHSPPTPTLP